MSYTRAMLELLERSEGHPIGCAIVLVRTRELLKLAVGCEHPDTCGGPTGQPICEPCIAFARAHVWDQVQ